LAGEAFSGESSVTSLRQFVFVSAPLVAVVLFAGPGQAQDTRTVSQPVIPAVCTKLGAQLQSTPDANGGTLRPEDETKLDTERIQKAIDGCGAGKAVELAVVPLPISSTVPPAGRAPVRDAFLTGPLELREGVTLLIDKGVTLYASRDPKVFEMAGPGDPGKCGTSEARPTSFPTFTTNNAARPRGGCRPLITVNAKNAAIMGEGTIDARGYAQILGKDYTWWQMARRAQPHDDLYYSIRMIVASHADGFILYGIHLNNSGNFHVSVNQTNGFTAWGVHLQTPVNKALIGTENDARNTDGIDPGTSENITIAHSFIDNGDDNIAIKQGVSHMSVTANHFYSGHGMSIGSETVLGQTYLLVDGLTEDHTTSGIRIKSNVKRGGPVHDLTYRNICMRNVPIPIAISPYYTNQTVEPFEDPKYTGDKVPDYKAITLENIFSMTPGDVLIAGLPGHITDVKLDHVFIAGITPAQVHLDYANLTVGLTNIPLTPQLTQNHVTVTGGVHSDAMLANPCRGRFVPYQ
jgi:polygalacturonase